MKRLSTDQIRRTFLDFFKDRDHTEVASSPLVPANDPTLLFTNAGMVQFKDVFTGKETRPYSRATTSQKCVRAGGKHNDLENVGYTRRHHTFFEMLGNFSFGDYFKQDAIAFAWELVTKGFGLPEDRLAVTVFKGEDGVPADDEAAAMWVAAGVPAERIFRLGKADNYWQMGDTGPQGPCSEIHFCMSEDTTGMVTEQKVAESDGWMEIWNLVFMQFVRETADGPLLPLPKPSVDTGAGLERVAMVLQGVESTYDTDGFRKLLDKIAARVGKTYGGFAGGEDSVSMRVIADHARATAFLIADGVQPSNEGRGYVLRRIMRRAIRHGDRLGFDDLFFHEACLDVVEAMKGAYPDLERAVPLIEKAVRFEETAFRRTLQRGLRLLEAEMARTDAKALDPDFVADLYDTYGFPIDLTRVIANEHGRTVDEAAAQEAVKRRQSGGEDTGLSATTKAVEGLWFQLRDALGATAFTGYEHDAGDAKVLAIVKDGARVKEAQAGDDVLVLLDRTPFYGESGGQVGDAGQLAFEGGRLEVEKTIKPLPELFVHEGKVAQGTLTEGQTVRAEVDTTKRNATRKNHSATHLLHLALKEVLGEHVQQKGSLVAPDRLRFDFSHFEPLKPAEVTAIEARVNELVLENAETVSKVGSMDDARAEGAMMLFGEKYGDRVRMVRIGQESLELCGGTHVARAGDIGLFKLVSDGAVAAGVRRVEAVTGMGALKWVQDQERVLKEAAAALKAGPEQVPDRIEKLQKKNRELERDLEKARTAAALGSGPAQDQVEELGGVKVLFKSADGTPKKALRPLADQLRDKLGSGVVVLTAAEDGRVALLVAATKDLVGKVNAGAVVKAASEAMGGSGGGRPDFAQGGGPAEKLAEGLAAARATIAG
ncbi:MAG: alanine--tRNA ligase [Deltaproteobacteria bacterium]|nr:alanine--tRNA ligase [Deltaproteobacteria bacterium]